jgi:predicted regulator of Ras-like GTPase activity (Roadblock/LC7/MglB family)
MNEQFVRTLETLKDLEGILGSFVIGPGGSVLAQDFPSYFGSAAYDIGARALRLKEALEVAEGDMSHCILRYGSHKVALRPLRGGLLTVVAESAVNMPALRMAMNLVARRLESTGIDTETHATPPPPTTRPRPSVEATDVVPPQVVAAATPEEQSAPQPRNRAVFFRGKRIQ